jgi:hypothetical protein
MNAVRVKKTDINAAENTLLAIISPMLLSFFAKILLREAEYYKLHYPAPGPAGIAEFALNKKPR